MTAPDPRLDEIQAIPADAIEAAARVMLDHLYSDKTLEVDDEDRNMMRAVLEAAHPVLLAELRKAHEALARVEVLADKWESGYGPGTRKAEVFGPQKVSIEFAVKSIRAAVAAANGDGQ